LANQLSTLSTSIEVIILAVDSLITLRIFSGLNVITFQLGVFIDFIIFGLTYTHQLAKTLYAAAICNGVVLIHNQYDIVYICAFDRFS
jgi:hypothetical protein